MKKTIKSLSSISKKESESKKLAIGLSDKKDIKEFSDVFVLLDKTIDNLVDVVNK